MKHVVKNGIDNLPSIHKMIEGKRLGLVTGPTGVDRELRTTVDILNENYNLVCLFGAEHGIYGNVQDGEEVGMCIDATTGLPVYSLYGESRHADKKMMDEVDTVIFDIQDVGLRFYTYLYTLTNMMQDCAKFGKPLIVLDRVNPLGGVRTEGTLLDERFSSFVGEYAVPTRYALTIGEFASYINTEKDMGCDLTICRCSGWSRHMYYDDTGLIWIQPSPNMPTLDTAVCYIGSCLFEGTNLSEGRGTTRPFEIIGAPWFDAPLVVKRMKEYDLKGVKFREIHFCPTFSKHKGQPCGGVQLHVTDRSQFESFKASLLLLDTVHRTHSEFEFIRAGESYFIDLLLGNSEIRKEGFEPFSFMEGEKAKIEAFMQKARKYMIYPM